MPGWQEPGRHGVGVAAQPADARPARRDNAWLTRRQAASFPVMPAAEVMQDTRPVTRSDLARDLRGLGVRAGGVLMVHTRMSAIGWVVGGAQTVVTALLDVLGPAGTLMAYQSKNDYEQWTARHDSSRPSPALPRRRARIWQQEAALAAARRRADQAGFDVLGYEETHTWHGRQQFTGQCPRDRPTPCGR